MKLIDKDALVAEIDRIENGLMDSQGNFAYKEDEGAYYTLCSLENFIRTLEVKEVDLEKEYKDFIKNDNGRSMFETAKHFFELGMRSTITEEDCKLIWNIGDEIPNMPEEEFFKELLKRFKAKKNE